VPEALVSRQVRGFETIVPVASGAAEPRDRFHSLVKPLLFGLACVLAMLAFVYFGGEVMEGDTRSFDNRLLHLAQAARSDRPWLVGVLQDLSALGSTTVLTLFTVVAVGYLTMVSSRSTGLLVAASTISAALVVAISKAAFARARPEAALAELVVPGLSFPSGHASISAVVFLTVGALVASTRSRTSERTYVLGAAALMTLLVGASRVALGVHWATDVVGGWALGAVWASAWLLVARWLAQKR